MHNREVFGCTTVAQPVLEMLLTPVVARGTFEAGCHDVPTRTTLADEIQRTKLWRHVERLVGRGRQRADEPDMGRGHRYR